MARPDRFHLVGLFRTDRADDESLVAYAWGCAHGDYAQFDDGGSARPADLRVSLMYPLIWDLVRWAKRTGCVWFDLGGIEALDGTRRDLLDGISAFKRRFSKQVTLAGAEWQFDANPRRARVARFVGRAAAPLRTLWSLLPGWS
jgi:hypothetical protein